MINEVIMTDIAVMIDVTTATDIMVIVAITPVVTIEIFNVHNKLKKSVDYFIQKDQLKLHLFKLR